ncbi:hypothetical protein [Streptomyces sp. LN245]|uniref:hypothetical protein n=1 Tax=Streptomyces sp. LN245 TaxID=3112975 RepID=UPI003712003E
MEVKTAVAVVLGVLAAVVAVAGFLILLDLAHERAVDDAAWRGAGPPPSNDSDTP